MHENIRMYGSGHSCQQLIMIKSSTLGDVKSNKSVSIPVM